MEARAVPAFVAIFVCALPTISVGNDNDGGHVVVPAVAAVAVSVSPMFNEPMEPWIHHKMDEAVREKLEAKFELAVERVREMGECGDLFTRLGADGIDMLKTGLYLPVHSYRHEIVVCGRDPASK